MDSGLDLEYEFENWIVVAPEVVSDEIGVPLEPPVLPAVSVVLFVPPSKVLAMGDAMMAP